ncbi:hypothetical protein [Chryseobacterium sp. YR221]|nr:hypothetical protein [Chryseobacterium sp. YR221]SMC49920.1 hypothetical protein SAMN02787074_1592 [Chryseobacterium sp. YR221]
MLDKNSVDEYLKLVDFNSIDVNHFEIVEFITMDKRRFDTIENSKTEYRDNSYHATFYDNNRRKLILDI